MSLPKQTHLVEGRRVRMGGRDFIVPALSFKQLRLHKDDLAKAGQVIQKDGDKFPSLSPETYSMVAMALQRNYPEITSEDVEEILDMNNFEAAVPACLGQGDAPLESGEMAAASH